MAAPKYSATERCACGGPLKVFVSSGRVAKACSDACLNKTYPRKKVSRPQHPTHKCVDCGAPVWARTIRCKSCCAWRAVSPIACNGCGNTFTPKERRTSKYCSRECFFAWIDKNKKHPGKRLGSGTYRKRARKYCVEYQHVDALKVFERDGWRCQICGRDTPKDSRGTFRGTAPELDHRIPLSKGGPHTYANTQCACRACNLRKGNKILGEGWVNLFTLF
jgi:hypothetical protein